MSTKGDKILEKYGVKPSAYATSRGDRILAKYGVTRSNEKAVSVSAPVEVETPSLIERIGSTLSGAAKSTASGYASALGTTQAVTGGAARKNYLSRDIEQWQKELETYRYQAKNATDAEEQKYFLLEAGKTANKIEAAKQNLLETETAGQSMQQMAKKLSASAQQDIQEAKQGLGKVGSFLVDTGVAGAQMLGDVAVGALTGGSALPSMFVRSAGSSAQEARDAGGTLGQQVAYGLGSGALSVATEKLLNVSAPFKKAFGEGVLDSAITKAAGKLGGTTLGKVALSAISEGGEEFAEALVQPLLQMATYDKNAIYDDEWLAGALYDAAIGAALGGIGGGVETVTSRKQTPAKAKSAAMTSAGEPTAETVVTGKGNAENAVQGISGGILEQEIERPAGNKNTAPEGAARKNQGETVKILQKLRENIPAVQEMQPIATVSVGTVEALPGRTMGEKAKALFDRIKGVVVRDGLGEVEINARSVKDDLSHGVGAAKAAVIPAIPEVIRTGRQIDFQENWKGRAYDGYVFAAPVAMDGRTVYVAAIVKKTSKNRLYLHEVVDSDGNIIKINNGESANPTSLVANGDAGTETPLFDTSMPQNSGAVKEPLLAAILQIKREAQAKAEVNTYHIDSPEGRQQFPYTNRVLDDSLGSARGGFDPFTAAQNQYGTLPEGENAVRPDDVPVSTNGRDRVSQSVVTAKGAAVTPDEFVPLLENATMNGEFSYIPITNSDTVQAAVERIIHVGWDAARAEWTANVRRGRAGADITALGGLLYNHAVNAGDTQAALDIFADYQQAVRNSAQGLQAARILKMMTPDNRLYMIQRSIYSMIERLGLPEGIAIDEELITRYRDADTETERDEIILEMQQNVADQIPSTLLDRWTALRYVNMLGNFKTQVRNISGNVGMRAVSAAKNTVAAALERLTGTERTKSVTVSRELLNASRADFGNVRTEAMGEGRYADTRMDPGTFWRGVEERRRIFRSGAMEGYRRATNWAMNNQYFGDEAFSRSAYARALAGYLKAQNVSAAEFTDQAWQRSHADFLDQARQYAIQEAQETTFRDHNFFSDWVSRVGRRADTPQAVRAVSEGLMPFRRTPANVLLRAEEYSPLGFLNTAVMEVRRRGGAEITGAEVVNSLAKALTGTGVFLVGMALANAGALRGADDEDEDQAAFDNLTGRQAYSLELPDGTSVTLDWLTPLAMPLFMGAQLEELRQEGGFELKDLESALLSIADPMLQMSMMQGINDTLTDLRYTDSSNLGQMAATAALGYLTQGLTNSLLGQAERVFEDDSTMNYADKGSAVPAWLQKELGAASRKVPGVDYSQVPYIDAWGRQEETGIAAERIFNNFFNPAYVSQWDVDEVERELQRVKDATGSTSVFPDRAEKSVTIGGEARALTAEQYVEYAKALGQERYKMAKEATSSSAYKAMSDADKASCIAKLYSVARAKSLKAIFPDYEPSAELAGYLDAEKEGITPVEFYAFKAGISGARSDEESTRQEKVMANINAMDISRKEKDFLFYLKYPKGDAGNAPWN